jgi:predicted TIM-barrel fold metal-dependent hydrolase
MFELMAKDPRLIVFPWLNPSSRDPKHIEELIAYVESKLDVIRGLKYHPSISQVGFDDPLLDPLLEFADKRGLPWIIHSGRADISDAQRVWGRARKYKNSAFIIAHLGGGVYDKIMEAIHFFRREGMPENVFFDSSQTTHSVLVKRYIESFGSGKLIFGSDIPFLDFTLVMQTILSHKFKDSDLEKIFAGNFESLLKLPA